MNQLFDFYNHFIAMVPGPLQWLVSLGILVLLVFFLLSLIKRSFIFLILLIVFVPASLPVLNNLWQQFLGLLNFIANRGGQ